MANKADGIVNGVIAAKATNVIDTTDYQFADFQGDAAWNITTEGPVWYGQNIFSQDYFLSRVTGTMNFAEVALRPNTIEVVWGISASAGETKENTPATASVYNFDNTLSSISQLEYLASLKRANSASKKLQFWMFGQLAGDFPLSATHGSYATHDMAIQGYANPSGEFAKIIWEN